MEETSAKEQPNKADNIREWRFPKGVSGNPKGRPISPTKRIKEIFKENPEKFDSWVVDYMEDKPNRKHVVEMIDGKPAQAIDHTSGGEPINVTIAGEVVQRDDNQ